MAFGCRCGKEASILCGVWAGNTAGFKEAVACGDREVLSGMGEDTPSEGVIWFCKWMEREVWGGVSGAGCPGASEASVWRAVDGKEDTEAAPSSRGA